MEIGAKIKRLRIKNNLTLEELADRCELSKGFLSQLERDLTSPSIDTLADIIAALGTTMSAFFEEETEEQIVFNSDDFFVKDHDDYAIHWIVPNAQKNEMEPIVLIVKAHSISMVMEPYEGETFGYMLQGKATLHYGEESYVLKKGETFYFKANETHYISNMTDKELKGTMGVNTTFFLGEVL